MHYGSWDASTCCSDMKFPGHRQKDRGGRNERNDETLVFSGQFSQGVTGEKLNFILVVAAGWCWCFIVIFWFLQLKLCSCVGLGLLFPLCCRSLVCLAFLVNPDCILWIIFLIVLQSSSYPDSLIWSSCWQATNSICTNQYMAAPPSFIITSWHCWAVISRRILLIVITWLSSVSVAMLGHLYSLTFYRGSWIQKQKYPDKDRLSESGVTELAGNNILLFGLSLSRAYDSSAVVRGLGAVTVALSLANPLSAPSSCLHL